MEEQQHRIRIATYNIGSLKKGRKLKNTFSKTTEWMEKEKIAILALQETKRRAIGSTQLKGFVMYNICHSKSTKGVAIIISNEMNKYIRNVSYISDRILFITAIFDTTPAHFFSIYAPIKEESDDEKKRFWLQLYDIVFSLPESDNLFIMGDFNGIIGECNELLELCQGKFGFGEMNDQGHLLIQFTRSANLIVCNTIYGTPDNNHTYFSKEKDIQTQLDFILARHCHLHQVQCNTKCERLYRVENCITKDSFLTTPTTKMSHRIVIADIKVYIDPSKCTGEYIESDTKAADLYSEKWIEFSRTLKRERLTLERKKQTVLEELAILQIQDNYLTGQIPNLLPGAPLLDEVKNAVACCKTREGQKFLMATSKKQVCWTNMTDLAILFKSWLNGHAIDEIFKQTIKTQDTTIGKDHKLIVINSYQLDIFDRILYRRITNKIGATRCEYLFKEELIPVQQYIIRRLEEEARKQTKTLGMVLLRLCNAYQRLPQTLMEKSLAHEKVPPGLINIIMLTYNTQISLVKTDSGDSVNMICLRFGSSLSRLLIALCIEFATKDLSNDDKHKQPLKQLGYGDCILLLSATDDGLKARVKEWESALLTHHLSLDMKKTRSTVDHIIINQVELPKTTHLIYLDQVFTTENCTTEMDTIYKINLAWDKWNSYSVILRSDEISLAEKGRIYISIIRPIAIYGSEWSRLTVVQEAEYSLMEQKMLRYLDIEHYTKNTGTILAELGAEDILEAITRNRLKSYDVYMSHWETVVKHLVYECYFTMVLKQGRNINWKSSAETDFEDNEHLSANGLSLENTYKKNPKEWIKKVDEACDKNLAESIEYENKSTQDVVQKTIFRNCHSKKID